MPLHGQVAHAGLLLPLLSARHHQVHLTQRPWPGKTTVCRGFQLPQAMYVWWMSPPFVLASCHTGAAPLQIYIPEVNYLLMIGTLAVVLGFKTSAKIANAYGVCQAGCCGLRAVISRPTSCIASGHMHAHLCASIVVAILASAAEPSCTSLGKLAG